MYKTLTSPLASVYALLSGISQMTNCVQVDPKTVTVQYGGTPPLSAETDIGFVPILPYHVWNSLCLASLCTSVAFDPMLQTPGAFVGSGPWRCDNISTGASGGTCTQDAAGNLSGQSVLLGGRVLLKRFDGYHRCCPNVQTSMGTSLQKLSWTDGEPQSLAGDGQMDLIDIAAAAVCFGMPPITGNACTPELAAYYDHPLFGVFPDKIDIGEIATMAFYFEYGITVPYCMPSPDPLCTSPLSGSGGLITTSACGCMDPSFDPFRVLIPRSSDPPVIASYQGLFHSSANHLILRLFYSSASNLPAPSLFSAQMSADPGHAWGSMGSATGVAGASVNSVVLDFGIVSAAHFDLRLLYSNALTASSDWDHVEVSL